MNIRDYRVNENWKILSRVERLIELKERTRNKQQKTAIQNQIEQLHRYGDYLQNLPDDLFLKRIEMLKLRYLEDSGKVCKLR